MKLLSFLLLGFISYALGAQIEVDARADSLSIQAQLDASNHAYAVALNTPPDSLARDTIYAEYVTYADFDGYLRYQEDVMVINYRRGLRITRREVCGINNMRRVLQIRSYDIGYPLTVRREK